VPNGGRYDGVAGVVAGMCVIERIQAAGSYSGPPLHLMVLRGEESAWFGKCYIGSLALFGQLPPACLDLLLKTPVSIDPPTTLAENISYQGGSVDYIREQLIPPLPYPIGRFYEVHIEQGPELVRRKIPVAVVSAICGNARYLNARAHGESGHSGTTPMAMRQDAVMRFARFLSLIENERSADALITVGTAHTNATRNAVSVIADELSFTLEVRSGTAEGLRQIQDLCAQYAVKYEIELGDCQRTEPVELDRAVQEDLIRSVYQATGVDGHVMPSGAGHDAAVFQQNKIPTGMIFIRNDHGSHNPRESMDMSDFLLAVDVLHHAIQKGIQ
jgi:N-carbamoyl-L-amino-acid hydrolase